ncbi:fumarylacetoacetate hydrolase family protein [Variovorax sp. GB1R11]|uniref:fumarylacetoacetate hydrolase family protein n=1 Tax=Variovorax sp. GB1R11 TaxID=3443741 RepID=UPI003F46B36A
MQLTFIHSEDSHRLCFVRGEMFATVPEGLASTDIANLAQAGPDELEQLRTAEHNLPASAWHSLGSMKIALAQKVHGKIICLGLNYAAHAMEAGREVPVYPSLFVRVASSLVSAGEPMIRPHVSDKFDYEAELMVVIGKGGRYIQRDVALTHVFGYTCFNDGSVRDYQRRTAQWTAGKNFDRTGAIGPVIVTADALPAGAEGLRISCRLNGVTLQDANTSQMLVTVAQAIEIISEFMTLEPGDLIAMGTPQGVGVVREPPVFMKPGDAVDVEIERVGLLSNPIEADCL